MIRIGLLGDSGRMGQWVARIIESEYSKKAKLVPAGGKKPNHDALLRTDVVIDFSSTSGMLALAQKALQKKGKLPAFVVGSTGWRADELKQLELLSEKVPVIVASNFSTGVLALQAVLRNAAPLLKRLGYTPVMVEAHHRHKKDAPSGTAKSLQKVIAPEKPDSVQTHSVRAGEIIGDHEITFYGPADHITLGHFAQDRSIFARGAIEVALWLAKKKKSKLPSGIQGLDQFFKERTASHADR